MELPILFKDTYIYIFIYTARENERGWQNKNFSDIDKERKLYIEAIGNTLKFHWIVSPTVPLQRSKTPTYVCLVYDTKRSDGKVPVMLELWGMWNNSFIAIAPRSTLIRNGSPWKSPIYGLNRINCILMLNRIVWIRTVWLNWIAWNSLKWNCFWHWNSTYIELNGLI